MDADPFFRPAGAAASRGGRGAKDVQPVKRTRSKVGADRNF